MNEILNENLNPGRIRELASQFQISRIILTAVELNIFSVLDKHLMLSSEVAKAINADARAADRLMNALVAFGFLRKTHGKFYNSEAASQFLVKGKPEFMGGLFHTNELWKTWGTLTNAVRAGTSVYDADDSNENWTETFITAMHYRAAKEAKIVSMMLELNNTLKMLDIGGGSGAFSMAFIEKNPELHAVIFDLESVIPLTKKYVTPFQYKDNIDYIIGDYLTDDLGCNYDLIFLSAIVHINSFEQNKTLLKKCYDTLNLNGQIVIKDWVMSEDRSAPLSGAIFSLNMLVGTECGDTFTESEIQDWLKNSGINKIEKKDTSFGTSLIIGHKI
jgi:precorrin-6B methylase 2